MRRGLLLLGMTCLPVVVLANGVSLPDTLNVALRAQNTSELGLEANFGWVSSEDGGDTWTWVCHESVLQPTSTMTPYYYLGQNATLVTVRSLGVALVSTSSAFRSTDGCEWSAPADLGGVNVRDFAFDPATPDHVLATTFNGGTGVTNGVWESDDAGATWHKTAIDLEERFFRNVRFSAADPSRVYTTATWYLPQPAAWVYVSDDGGDTWNEIPWVFTVGSTLQSNVDIVATSPTDAGVAYARTNGGTDYLLRTSDGGLSWGVVFSAPDDIRGVTFEPGTNAVWVGTVFQGTWRSTDGITFTPVADAPATRGLAADSRGVFAVANNYEDGFALGVTTNMGASWTGLFRFTDLDGTRPCPAGSDVATICEPLWPALAQLLGLATPTPTPGGGDDDDDGGPGCSCSLSSGSATFATFAPFAIAALALALTARRRR